MDVELISRQSPARVADMALAGDQVRECYRLLDKTGANVVGQVIAGNETFYEWNHYPEGDVFDGETSSQYYYHSHRGPNAEHGHFHTFLRAGGIPSGVEPAAYDGEWERPMGDDAIAHLVAISMDPAGYPVALFTVNRWVTGETFYRADDVIGMLDTYKVDHTFPCLATNMWVSAMIRLFYPQICQLIRERDTVIAAHAAKKQTPDIYEDRKLEITSRLPISVDEQIAAIQRVLGKGKTSPV